MKHRSMIAVVAAFLLMGCSGGAGDEPLYAGTRGVSVSVEATGGACSDSPCRLTISSDRDTGGTAWEDADGATGSTDTDATVELFQFIREWLADEDRPLEGACPSADTDDRVAVSYTALPTGPDAHLADAVVLSVDTCRHALPEEFLARTRQMWDETTAPWPLP